MFTSFQFKNQQSVYFAKAVPTLLHAVISSRFHLHDFSSSFKTGSHFSITYIHVTRHSTAVSPVQAGPERELITLCKLWNLRVSTLQLSSLLGRSRFRSGRFGGGRAAGELVLDCRSRPVNHLDGLIVVQSQLSPLENLVELHSKKPPVQLYRWRIPSQTLGDHIPASLHSVVPISTFTCKHT